MWCLRIEDPSGETRTVIMRNFRQNPVTLGRGSAADIALKDPTSPPMAAEIHCVPVGKKPPGSPYWLKALDRGCPLKLGDLTVRESHWPAGLPLRVGESRITVEREYSTQSLPAQPPQVRHWLTIDGEGRNLLWMAKKSAETPLSIYIAGETGTGKEVLAHLLHAWSARASGPFIPLHCGALALSLAESELFGHVKGAFTGAIQHRPGALLQAHNGTLFLDEVGDLSLDIQVKLLRFLENGEIRPVGSDQITRANVRILCATHLPLKKLVEQGKFRRDLYFRLASVTLQIPPLRKRPADIQMLATRFAAEMGKVLTPQAILRLQAHTWPGNIRELRHAIERACGLSSAFSPVLGEDSFEFLLTSENIQTTPEIELGASVLTLDEMERALLLKALRLARGNRRRTAEILGVARSTVFEMLKRHRVRELKVRTPVLARQLRLRPPHGLS